MPGWLDSATLSTGASHVLPVLLDAAVKSAVLLVLAAVAATAMRRSSAAARHLLWFLAVTGLLLMPVVSITLPAWQILPPWIDLSIEVTSAPVQPPEAERPEFVALGSLVQDMPSDGSLEPVTRLPPAIGEAEATGRERRADVQEAVVVAPLQVPPEPSQEPRRSFGHLVLACMPAVWAAGALLVVGWLCLGMVNLRMLARRSEVITEEPWMGLLGSLSDELKLRQRVLLLRATGRAMPMAWGIFRPRLLLPAEAADWPGDRRRVVLLHELAHIKRRDPLTQMLTQLACALYWFNPLVWIAARWMVTERERACDDLVLAAGSPACDYADHVLQIASGLRSNRLTGVAAIAMARPSSLEGRLLAILDNRRSRRALTRTAALLLVVAFVGIILPIGMMRAMGSGEKPMLDEPTGADSQAGDHSDLDTRLASATAPAVPAGKAGLRIRYAVPGDEEEAEFGWDDGSMTRRRFTGVVNQPSVRIRNGGEAVVDHLTPGSYRVFRIKRQRTAGRSAVVAHCDERMVELREGTITLVEYVWNGWPIEGELVGATHEEMGRAKTYVQSLDPKWPRLLDAFECPPDGKWKTAPVPPGEYRVFVHVTRDANFRIHFRAPDLGEFIGDAKVTVTKEARPGPVRIVRLAKPKPNVPRTTSPGLSTLKIRFEIPGAGETNEFVVEPFDIAGICKPGMLSTSPPPPGIELERTVTIRNGGEAILHNLLPGRWRIMRWKEVPGLPMGSVGCDDSVVEVEADKTTTADFVRRECWPLEGELADAKPNEIAHAFVTVQSALPGSSGSPAVYDMVKCAPDGTWKTLPIPPGEYWVVARLSPSPVGAKAPGQAKITVSQGVRPPRVRLSKDSVPWPSAGMRRDADPRNSAATRPVSERDAAASGAQTTGKVIERTVNADAVGKDCVIDFDSGKLGTPPKNPAGGFPSWFKAQGLDAGCTVEPTSPGLWGFDMVVAPASAEAWDEQDNEPFLTLRNHVETGTVGTPAVMSAAGKLPATYVFKTREGGVGVLQIVGFSEEPKGLRIRYRLFGSGDKPRTAEPTPRTTPPVGERKSPTSKPAANAESLKLPATLPAAGAEAGPPVVMQISVVEITGKRDQLDPGKVLQLLPAGLTLKEGLGAIKGVGEAEVLAQPTIMVKPWEPAIFMTGEKVPFVREMVTGENGKPQPKVTYENIGLTIDMKASWRPQSHPALADIGVHIRQTSLGQSMADVSSGVTAPVLSSRWCDRFVALHDGESVWIAGSEQPIPVARKEAGSKREFKLLLVRLTANHQDESGASAATRPTGPVPMTRPAGSAN